MAQSEGVPSDFFDNVLFENLRECVGRTRWLKRYADFKIVAVPLSRLSGLDDGYAEEARV